ncbi:MAG: dienelactone hydrolase family protein [Halothiobacillus sp.]|nr:dienelactone hydrolase family protein [Halothiobacillus sp.]
MTVSNSTSIELKTIPYTLDDVTMQGALAVDASKQGRRPAVLVVHEWWGRNAFSDDRAKALAKLGYVGFAVDMYGNHAQADNPTEASAFSSAIGGNLPLMKGRFMAAIHAVKQQPEVDPERIAVIGFCFGGTVALSMVRQGVSLRAMAGFHTGLGGLVPIAHSPINVPVRLYMGGNDPFVPTEQVDTTVKEMRAAGADIEVVTYPNAKHAFTNPAATQKGEKFNLPLQYNEQAANDSWRQMSSFLADAFKA